jgi:hypothetical protein
LLFGEVYVELNQSVHYFVKINWTVEKLFMGYFSHENSSIAPLKRISKYLRSFCVFPLADLNQSVYCLWKSVHWLKVILWVFFIKISPVAPLAWNLELFYNSIFSACQPESISMLIVKIGHRVIKLLLRGFLHENSSLLLWNEILKILITDFCSLVLLDRSVYY